MEGTVVKWRETFVLNSRRNGHSIDGKMRRESYSHGRRYRLLEYVHEEEGDQVDWHSRLVRLGQKIQPKKNRGNKKNEREERGRWAGLLVGWRLG